MCSRCLSLSAYSVVRILSCRFASQIWSYRSARSSCILCSRIATFCLSSSLASWTSAINRALKSSASCCMHASLFFWQGTLLKKKFPWYVWRTSLTYAGDTILDEETYTSRRRPEISQWTDKTAQRTLEFRADKERPGTQESCQKKRKGEDIDHGGPTDRIRKSARGCSWTYKEHTLLLRARESGQSTNNLVPSCNITSMPYYYASQIKASARRALQEKSADDLT